MKRLILAVCILFLACPVWANIKPVTLMGSVEYTVETARQEAFAGVEYTIPLSMIKPHLKDPNYSSNKRAMANGVTDLGDRWIEKFSDGGYSIVYKKDRYKTYGYDAKGNLEDIGIRTSLNFPRKVYGYDTLGKLADISFYVKINNDLHIYIYTPDGVLIHHWINNKCYDTNGKVILESY